MTRRRLTWAAAVGGGALIVLLARIGLDRANQVAGVVGMFVGLGGLALTAYTVVQGRASHGAPLPPPAPPTAARARPVDPDGIDVADQPAAPEPTGPDHRTPVVPPRAQESQPAGGPGTPAPATLTDAPRGPAAPIAAAPIAAPAPAGSRPAGAGTAFLGVERRTANGRLSAVERVSDVCPLTGTPDDPTFAYAVDAACSLCGATYRMGVRRKELVPPPGPARWAAALVCGILTVVAAAWQIWLVPQILRVGFEAPTDHWAESAFNRSFAVMCALGAALIVLVMARWSRNQLRVDATHTLLLAGPTEPEHAHVGRVFSDVAGR